MAASSASRNSASTRLSVGTAMLQKSRWQTIQRQKWNSSQLTWMSCSLRPWPAAANHRLSKDIAKIGACDAWWPKNLRSFSETGKARNAESSKNAASQLCGHAESSWSMTWWWHHAEKMRNLRQKTREVSNMKQPWWFSRDYNGSINGNRWEFHESYGICAYL